MNDYLALIKHRQSIMDKLSKEKNNQVIERLTNEYHEVCVKIERSKE